VWCSAAWCGSGNEPARWPVSCHANKARWSLLYKQTEPPSCQGPRFRAAGAAARSLTCTTTTTGMLGVSVVCCAVLCWWREATALLAATRQPHTCMSMCAREGGWVRVGGGGGGCGFAVRPVWLVADARDRRLCCLHIGLWVTLGCTDDVTAARGCPSVSHVVTTRRSL
jgi:hypothetical protein